MRDFSENLIRNLYEDKYSYNLFMKNVHKKIHNWYKAHGRLDLPWRTTADPYHIYLSEVMLQQTQVTTVLSRYYFPFLKQFPTL